MKVLFLDESGDHNLSVIDPSYPVFVLGGVIVDKEYADGTLTVAFDDFKRRMFGRTDIVLHTADIVRNRNGFEGLQNAETRSRFYAELNSLLLELRYEVVACAIRKEEHSRLFGAYAPDPYHLSFEVLVEMLCNDVGKKQSGLIIAEKRNAILDQELQERWLALRDEGSRHFEGAVIQDRIQALDLRGKRENIAGLQIADLIVSPIGRHILGKMDNEDWQIVEQKLRRSRSGQVEGYGMVVLPK